jgi:hypothetical protein
MKGATVLIILHESLNGEDLEMITSGFSPQNPVPHEFA